MKRRINHEEVVRRLKEGQSYGRICREMNISSQSLSRIAIKYGVNRGTTKEWMDNFRMDWQEVTQQILKATSLCLVLFAMTANAETVYVNSEDGLRVRTKPTTESTYTQVLQYGEKVAVIDDEPLNGWLRIEGGGYILSEYTQDTDPFEDMEYLGNWRVTAYAETGYCCANGQYPTTGYTIACNSLPFGTQVYIDGVGFRTVEDRGPAWLGSEWCDLYLGDYQTCVQWGNQYRDVYLVPEEEEETE